MDNNKNNPEMPEESPWSVALKLHEIHFNENDPETNFCNCTGECKTKGSCPNISHTISFGGSKIFISLDLAQSRGMFIRNQKPVLFAEWLRLNCEWVGDQNDGSYCIYPNGKKMYPYTVFEAYKYWEDNILPSL